MHDDAEFLRQFLSGNSQEAFAKLVERHLKVVYHAALRQVNGDGQLAEDVSQVVFAKLATKARSLRHRTSLAGWLYVTTRFEAARAARSESRRRARETKAQIMQDILNEPGPPLDWEQLRPVIDDVLYGLDEKERELVLLRFFEGIPYPEIAERVGGTAEAVRFRLDRSLERIRVRLEKRGIRSTFGALGLVLGAQAGLATPSGLAASISAASLSIPAAGGVTAVGLLEFMNTSKIVIGVTLVAGSVGLGLSLHEHAVIATAERSLISLNQQNESLSGQIEALQNLAVSTRLSGGPSTTAGGTRHLDQLTGKPEASPMAKRSEGQADTASVATHPPAINRRLSNDPAVRSGLAGWITACENVSEGPLFKSLGLTSDQVESLEALQLQFNINMGDNILTLRPEGATVDDVFKSISSLLGASDLKEYLAYQPTQFVRSVASSLAGNLYDTDTPLSSTQADQLTQILAQNSSPKGGAPFPGDINWNDALAKAETILSPQQLQVLNNLATVISSQPGIWGAINGISPGSTGRSAYPPQAFFASSGGPK